MSPKIRSWHHLAPEFPTEMRVRSDSWSSQLWAGNSNSNWERLACQQSCNDTLPCLQLPLRPDLVLSTSVNIHLPLQSPIHTLLVCDYPQWRHSKVLERLSRLLPRFAFTPGSSLTRVIENTSALERTIRKCNRCGMILIETAKLSDSRLNCLKNTLNWRNASTT